VRAIWFETISDVLENSVAFAKNKKFSRQKFYGCHHEMVDHRYEISMVQMAMAIFPITSNYSFISRQQDLTPLFNNIKVTVYIVSFIGGGNRNTRRKLPTCRKSLTNFIT
jgi:hypothetical protein